MSRSCEICEEPTGDAPATLTVDGRVLKLCSACSDWEYLRAAERLSGYRAENRIDRARDAAKWARKAALAGAIA